MGKMIRVVPGEVKAVEERERGGAASVILTTSATRWSRDTELVLDGVHRTNQSVADSPGSVPLVPTIGRQLAHGSDAIVVRHDRSQRHVHGSE